MHGWLVAARPLYLPGGYLFYVLGVLLGRGAARAFDVCVGSVVVVLVHVITHFVNDAEDVATDELTTAPTFLSGGSRAIQRGLITPARLLQASGVLALVVLLCAAVTALRGDAVTALLYVGALALGYSYSGRPLTLGRRGLGEVTAAVVMAWIVPIAGARAAGGTTPTLDAAVALLVVETMFARLCTAYPDIDADRATAKWTIPALLGRRACAVAYAAAAVAIAVVGAWVSDGDHALPLRANAAIVATGAALVALAITTRLAERRPVLVPMLGLGANAAGMVALFALVPR